MRRKEREITDYSTIDKIIQLCTVCRIGLYDGSVPYIVPVNFYYSDRTVYFHSAGSGKKLDCLKAAHFAAVEWDIPGSVVTGPNFCEYGFEYVSVVATGQPFFVASEEEKGRILASLTARYIAGGSGNEKPGGLPELPPPMVRKTVVVGIELDAVTGKASSENYLAALLS